MKHKIAVLLTFAMVAGFGSTGWAETTELRVAKQFGIGYLPLVVMEHEKLIEKEAAALGLTHLDVSWVRMGNALALNDLMFAGKLDISAGSPAALVLLWSKTKGNPAVEIKGIAGLSVYAQLLNTNKPTIRSIRDFTDGDRIAMGGTKITASALVLQMAAEEVFGPGNAFKLDTRTISLSHPDGMVALVSGNSEIVGHLTAPPYQYEELKYPGVRTILNSNDVMGGKTTGLMAWTTTQFRSKNPKVYRAVFQALKKAIQEIDGNPRHAAEIYLEDSKDKSSLDDVVAILKRPDFAFDMTPYNTMKYANFMKHIGTITVAPADWKDLFFEDINQLPGS